MPKAAQKIQPNQADALRKFKAQVFQALGHPTRIHIAECLRGGEQPVSAILDEVGVEPANLSQHLALLRGMRLVVSRRAGTQMFYSLADPLLGRVLDEMRAFFQAHIEESMAVLREMGEAV